MNLTNLSHKKDVYLKDENVYPKGQDDPDNWRPDKWSFTVSKISVPFCYASVEERR
jgi:hypothetical protein